MILKKPQLQKQLFETEPQYKGKESGWAINIRNLKINFVVFANDSVVLSGAERICLLKET